MIIAVVAVRVVQMAAHEVVDVIAVRHRFMAAARAVDVILGVGAAGVLRRAAGRVAPADGQRMLLDLAALGMVQVAVVDVIDMAFVLDGGVAAAGPVLMAVAGVMIVAHGFLLVLG